MRRLLGLQSARSVIENPVALKWKDRDLGQIVVRINGPVIRTQQVTIILSGRAPECLRRAVSLDITQRESQVSRSSCHPLQQQRPHLCRR